MTVETVRSAARLVLGGVLVFAGTSHLTFARAPFRAQVPKAVVKAGPLSTDRKRRLRLLGQPLLVARALWTTRTPR